MLFVNTFAYFKQKRRSCKKLSLIVNNLTILFLFALNNLNRKLLSLMVSSFFCEEPKNRIINYWSSFLTGLNLSVLIRVAAKGSVIILSSSDPMVKGSSFLDTVPASSDAQDWLLIFDCFFKVEFQFFICICIYLIVIKLLYYRKHHLGY